VSPEAAAGGTIGLVEDGDIIEISIPDRSINLLVDDQVLQARREYRDAVGWEPENRERVVSAALKIYASMALSADKGAARELPIPAPVMTTQAPALAR